MMIISMGTTAVVVAYEICGGSECGWRDSCERGVGGARPRYGRAGAGVFVVAPEVAEVCAVAARVCGGGIGGGGR